MRMPGVLAAVVLLGGSWALAHCDTMDGPVVAEAQKALNAKDVTPVLKWVRPADEADIREQFAKTLAVRAKGDDAKDLADRYFFETLVRVHRAGEGEPYTGLKPSGTEVEPGIRAADGAMEKGSADEVTRMLTQAMAEGINRRFHAAHDAAAHSGQSVEAGRKAVAAYVQFMHYVESVHKAVTGEEGESHGHAAPAKAAGDAHHHED